jgi:hypothetical protein
MGNRVVAAWEQGAHILQNYKQKNQCCLLMGNRIGSDIFIFLHLLPLNVAFFEKKNSIIALVPLLVLRSVDRWGLCQCCQMVASTGGRGVMINTINR